MGWGGGLGALQGWRGPRGSAIYATDGLGGSLWWALFCCALSWVIFGCTLSWVIFGCTLGWVIFWLHPLVGDFLLHGPGPGKSTNPENPKVGPNRSDLELAQPQEQ